MPERTKLLENLAVDMLGRSTHLNHSEACQVLKLFAQPPTQCWYERDQEDRNAWPPADAQSQEQLEPTLALALWHVSQITECDDKAEKKVASDDVPKDRQEIRESTENHGAPSGEAHPPASG
jgi:hypothetical protein